MPGVAFDDAFDNQPNTPGTLFSHHFHGVFRAMGMEPAAFPEHGAYCQLI